MTGDNRRKTLGEIISLEAWHEPFSKADKKVDLFVDVVFMNGRLGGEEASEVRFTLGLRAAEVVVIIPPTEPAKVDRASVSRDAPTTTVKVSKNKAARKVTKRGAQFSGNLSDLKPSLKGALSMSAAASAHDDLRVAATEAVRNMRLLHSLGSDGNHRWSVSAIGDDTLFGRPWDTAKKPRLKVIDQRADRSVGLAPAINVEVRCRREDLVISNIKLKDPRGIADRMRRGGKRNREAAAEAFIRSRLFEEGLLGGDSEDRYALMTLAEVAAESD